MTDPYRDPKRKVGSQSETPTIRYKNGDMIVDGYQNFAINKITKGIV